MKITTYKDLIVWQKAMDLVDEIYRITDLFPQKELYVLISQMRRAAISIPSNIAEGRYRSSRKDYRQFLITSFSSGAELETQIEVSKRRKYLQENEYVKADMLLQEVMKMLNAMIDRLAS